MEKYTFVTDIETTSGAFGHLTDCAYYTQTIAIPTQSDIRAAVREEITARVGRIQDRLKHVEESIDARARDASRKAASEAKALADSIVEHAREAFAETIAELLMPHYRLLEQHLGLESPVGTVKANAASAKKRPNSARKTSPSGSAGKSLPASAGKKKAGTSAKSPKKKTPAKPTAASRRTKGAKSCREK